MSTAFSAVVSKFLGSTAKAFGMTFGSKVAQGQQRPKFDSGVKGLAQSFLATSAAKSDTSFTDLMTKMQGTVVNPTAQSVMSGSTTPPVSLGNVPVTGAGNPKMAQALNQLFARASYIDPNLDKLIRSLQEEGSTPQPTLQQGRIKRI